MKPLYELETKAAELIIERMRQTIADALPDCKPMRQGRDVVMTRHHCYERTLKQRQVRPICDWMPLRFAVAIAERCTARWMS